MQRTEIDLRSQISLYDEKYEEFQNALARSNKVFSGFKGDMELVSCNKLYCMVFIYKLIFIFSFTDVKKNS